jgi:hypothetical protein
VELWFLLFVFIQSLHPEVLLSEHPAEISVVFLVLKFQISGTVSRFENLFWFGLSALLEKFSQVLLDHGDQVKQSLVVKSRRFLFFHGSRCPLYRCALE